MFIEHNGHKYPIYVYYESFGGGTNNLCVADVIRDGGVWCSAGAMATRLTTGTSLNGKAQAVRNAKRNFARLVRQCAFI